MKVNSWTEKIYEIGHVLVKIEKKQTHLGATSSQNSCSNENQNSIEENCHTLDLIINPLISEPTISCNPNRTHHTQEHNQTTKKQANFCSIGEKIKKRRNRKSK